jgi:parallel beta-helix repeat protein
MVALSWIRGSKKHLTRNGLSFVHLEDRTMPAPIMVINTNDSGAGSLRQAILDANSNPGLDTIDFDIPSGGVQIIQPGSPLPALSDPAGVLIDGFSQPGSHPNSMATGSDAVLLINLDGTNAGTGANGLLLAGANNTVQGLVIDRFGANGILLESVGNTVRGNFIGTTADGMSAAGNGAGDTVPYNSVDAGVQVYDAANNLVGGFAPSDRNVISGNHKPGVVIFGWTAAQNRVAGNYIGTTASGTAALGNEGEGVWLVETGSSLGNVIGGTEPGAGNLISGNTYGTSQYGNLFGDGVRLDVSTGTVQGNFIGTDRTGGHAVGNVNGLSVFGGSVLTLGGIGTGAGNLISGNPGFGVDLDGSTGKIQGNKIGSDVTGMTDVDNVRAARGVQLIRSSNVIVGATDPGAGNLVSGNAEGIVIEYGSGIVVQGNKVGTNVTGDDFLHSASGGIAATGNITLQFGVTNCLVGGTVDAARNIVVTANGGFCVYLAGPNVSGNSIQGNYLGLDVTGRVPLRSLRNDVQNGAIGFDGDVHDNLIGGSIPGAGNVMPNGVWIADGSHNNAIQGNLIGTDASGKVAVGHNSNIDALIELVGGAHDNLVGTNLDGVNDGNERNVISGSVYGGDGIFIDATSTLNKIMGNFIGTDITGTAPLGNNSNGMLIYGSNNLVGGILSGAGNVIAYNKANGVLVALTNSGNTIRGNSIHDNTGLGIRLVNGGNNLQSQPFLTAASFVGGTLIASGSLTSAANTSYPLDFYASATGDPSGFGEGARYLGTATVVTGAAGTVSFTLSFTVTVSPGEVLTATATDPANDTSAFSNWLAVNFTVPTVTTAGTSAATPLFGTDGVTLTATVAAASAGAGTPTGAVAFYDGATFLGTAPLSGGTGTLSLTPTQLAAGPHSIQAVYAGAGLFLASSTTVSLTVLAPSSIEGLVYVDFNNDGQVNFGETAVAEVTITLTGTDDLGHAVNRSLQSDTNGIYSFADLRPSNSAGYTVTKTPPAGLLDGIDTLGTVGGVPTGNATVNDVFSTIVLSHGGSIAENYNFGEQPATTGSIVPGQTAGIGFWQNKNGQALIAAVNGGPTATQLGHWLAVTFPNMYAGLDGKANSDVAAFYKTLFARTARTAPGGPPKVDAQVMATALAVYVTNLSLAGTTAAGYGFLVTDTGVGTQTFNVGSDGSAFGAANNTAVSVLDLLFAVNARSTNGLLYDGDGNGQLDSTELGYRFMANDLFSAINSLGHL